MLNQAVLVGRIATDPELKQTESGKNVSNIMLAVPRSFKNVNGQYDTDFISCVLWRGVAESTVNYCKKGDLVGVKGRIQSRTYESGDEFKHTVEVVAEKITFLSSKKDNNEKEI